MIRSKIIGVGSALPERVVPNQELESIVDTSSEWIEQRTAIKQRYGKVFFDSLPDYAFSSKIEDVSRFFEAKAS